MSQIKYWLFIFTLSIVHPNDEGGYRLIGNSTQDYYQDIESVFEMSLGAWDFLMNFSGRQTVEFVTSKEQQDDIVYGASWSRVIATMRMGEKVTPNHEAQKQNGTSYTVTHDPITGKMTSYVGNDEHSIQMIEMVAQDEVGSLFQSDGGANVLYPFGSDSVRYVGDVWMIEDEAEKSGNVFAWDEFEGTQKSKISYTLKKIKEKRGNKIAYIKLNNIVEIIGVGGREDKSAEIQMSTVVQGNIKFNITTGLMESCKMSTAITTTARDLEDDKIKKFSMALSAKLKQKLK